MTGGMIIKPPVSALDQYDPNRHRLNVAAIDYSIDEAKRIRDWPALEKAVDAKIEEQIRFVAWWKGSVAHGGGSKNRERGSYSLRDAEHLTGMSQQRVSDLTKRLALPAKYRERLLGSGYFAAFLASVENVRGTTGTGQNEWFTPAEYVGPARQQLNKETPDLLEAHRPKKCDNAEANVTLPERGNSPACAGTGRTNSASGFLYSSGCGGLDGEITAHAGVSTCTASRSRRQAVLLPP